MHVRGDAIFQRRVCCRDASLPFVTPISLPMKLISHRIVRAVLCTSVLLLAGGCVSTNILPQSAEEANFDSGTEGKTGWSKYEEMARFEGVTREEVFNAAKSGLGHAGFALVRADIDKGLVMGKHGMTAHDWNVVAGVYFRERETAFDVKVIAEGSKDIGFSGDATSGAWTGRILNGMRAILGRSGTIQ